MAKLIIIWCDNFGKNYTPLHKNDMTAIPNILFRRSSFGARDQFQNTLRSLVIAII